jgi:hypothetical protein
MNKTGIGFGAAILLCEEVEDKLMIERTRPGPTSLSLPNNTHTAFPCLKTSI